MKALIYARFLLLPLLVMVGFHAGGWWNFITPVICFVIHPVMNLLQKNRSHSVDEDLEGAPSFVYRLIEAIYVPVLISLTIWSLYQGSRISGPAYVGLAVSTGMVNGILGFTLAHEFIHRTNKTEKVVGHILLLNNFYMHYAVEHIWGHHAYASTLKDPHTARLGESFYRFLPRAISRTFLNACEIEKKQLARQRRSWLSIHNRILFFLILQLILTVLLLLSFGSASLCFFLLQSVVAVLLLHAVNYLQHYGLLRKEIEPGHTERMAEHHCWNSGNRLNGLSLFQVENHADHHMHPTHPYETLTSMNSPEHPTGYSGMIVLSLIPSLWFRIVHKRLYKQLNQLS